MVLLRKYPLSALPYLPGTHDCALPPLPTLRHPHPHISGIAVDSSVQRRLNCHGHSSTSRNASTRLQVHSSAGAAIRERGNSACRRLFMACPSGGLTNTRCRRQRPPFTRGVATILHTRRRPGLTSLPPARGDYLTTKHPTTHAQKHTDVGTPRSVGTGILQCRHSCGHRRRNRLILNINIKNTVRRKHNRTCR